MALIQTICPHLLALQLGVMTALGLDAYAPAVATMALSYPSGSWLSTGATPTTVPPKLPSPAALIAFELHVPASVGNGTTAAAAGADRWSGSAAELGVSSLLPSGLPSPYWQGPSVPSFAQGEPHCVTPKAGEVELALILSSPPSCQLALSGTNYTLFTTLRTCFSGYVPL